MNAPRPEFRFRRMPAAFCLLLLLAGRPAVATSPVDTLSVEEILARRNARLDSLLSPESRLVDTAGVSALLDRIRDGGAGALDSLDRANDGDRPAIRGALKPFAMSSYNRIEGVRTGMGFELKGPGPFILNGAGAYGFSNHRWSVAGGFGFDAGRKGPSLRIEGEDRIVPFGPNREIEGLGLQALVAGQDRQDYLRRRGGRLIIRPLVSRTIRSRLTLFHHEELPVAAATDYSFFGGDYIEEANPMTDRGRSRGASVGGFFAPKEDLFQLEVEAGLAGGELGGDFDYSWQMGRVTLRPVFPDGGVLNLSVAAMNTGGGPPVQSRAFLGGEANLRGYERLKFVGKQVISTRVEYETGIDILGRTGIGLLKALKVQFIPFADAGSTWGETTGVERTTGNLEGSVRSSVGLGFQRDLWLPGARAIRLDVIRRTDGAPDPWSLWFRLVPLAKE